MKTFMKKYSSLALVSCAINVSANAASDDQMRISKLEAKMRDCGTTNARGTYGANLADASPNIDGYGFYVSADAILFQISQGNNQFGVIDPDGGDLGGTQNLKEVFTNFDWDLGFKVGLGYYAEHDAWQTGFEFSYLQSNAQNNATAPGSGEVVVSDNIILDSPGYSSLSDHWNAHFYNLDWKLGKEFFVSKYLSFFPSFGVKSTWFFQQRNLKGFDGAPPNDTYKIQDDFTGVGPLVDIMGKFYFGRNFSFFGGLDAAVLFAKNKSSISFLTTPLTNQELTTGSLKRNHVTPFFALKLGLGYDTNFSDDQFNLGIKLSYENQYYGNANHMMNQDAWDNAYDISMQGVDLSFVFSF